MGEMLWDGDADCVGLPVETPDTEGLGKLVREGEETGEREREMVELVEWEGEEVTDALREALLDTDGEVVGLNPVLVARRGGEGEMNGVEEALPTPTAGVPVLSPVRVPLMALCVKVPPPALCVKTGEMETVEVGVCVPVGEAERQRVGVVVGVTEAAGP